MDALRNILDSDILEIDVKFAAMFILCYETLKEYVISQPRDFFCDPYTCDCEEGKESLNYKEKVRKLDKDVENASLKWFVENGAISNRDYERYHEIRKRRNEIVHELLSNLLSGFSETDIGLYKDMRNIYSQIDRWWINKIEIPINGEYETRMYDENGVMGMQSVLLQIINEIMFGDETSKEEYKNILDNMKRG